MEGSDEAPSFPCGECNMRFERKRDLIYHRRIHSLSYPHVCTVCNRAFNHKGNLKRHFRIHTGEGKITCNICSVKFRDNSHLRDHKKKHSKEKTVICEICNKRFRYKRSLITHMKIHAREPLICPSCSRKFTKKGFFVRHTLQCHPEQQSTPEGSNEQLNEWNLRDSGVEGHENSSHNEEFDVQGMQDLGEGPSNRTDYVTEGSSCEGTDAHCMIEPGGESSLQGSSNLQMEDPGEGPSYCERTDFQRTDNIESPSSEEIGTLGMEDSGESSSSWEESQSNRIENYEEGSSYEDVIRGIEETGSLEIQDPGEGPSRGITQRNIGGETDLLQSVNPPGDMVPYPVDSSASSTSEEE